ncbi:MAG: retropepsin-like aspartic protease [Flavobacteriaceae bacterium]|nr:clan AA aspartic protease [Flavobacteriaceae bacterium]
MSSLREYLTSLGFERIGLKKLKTGHYKFSVIINDIPGKFILDTGASTSCIGIMEAHPFQLVTEKSDVKAAGAGAVDMETHSTQSSILSIGSIVLHNWPFVLFDLVHVNHALTQVAEEKVDGIIGADILKKLHAVIDYGRNCVYFKK